MRISHQWLKKLVDVRLRAEELAERLSLLGLEIESYEHLGAQFEGFVVGQVIEKRKHPNADKLVLCTVSIGQSRLEIVCGAPNVAEGQKVAVAQVGATVPRNQHDPNGEPFVIERTKIRGVESNGMICSNYELGLGDDKNGILVLDPKGRVGTPLAKYFGLSDVIYEIEVTANRGDWLSHLGVAREIGALTNKEIKLPQARFTESSVLTKKVATVQIKDTMKCRRYSARVLRNVKVQPSPQWLQDMLASVGVRPINNVVDVTNYVMLELGQPLHAFDFDKLSGNTIVVKCANDGDEFITLDGKTRKLTSDMLMICDGEGPVAIGGVMGGADSEITESTTSVLLESANFDPRNVRRTARSLGLSTDASQRFERSVDVELTTVALNRASALLQEISGVEILRGVIDVYQKLFKAKRVKLRTNKTNSILGTDLTTAQISSILKRLGLHTKSRSGQTLSIEIPSFRSDLSEEIDLIEEVARVYGYDKIETRTRSIVEYSTTPTKQDFRDTLRQYFIGAGFNEIIANTLQDKSTALMAEEPIVEVINPVSVDMAVLRPSMIPGTLHIVRNNQFKGTSDLRLFEIGRTYTLKKGGSTEQWGDFVEEERFLVVISGRVGPSLFGADSREADLFDLKGEIDSLFAKFHLDKYRLISYDSDRALTVNSIVIEIEGTYAGFLGKVKREILQRFEIEGEVFVGEVSVEVLDRFRSSSVSYKSLPKYPTVSRDVAFVVDRAVRHQDVEQAIREGAGSLLREVSLFDVYEGQQVASERKSLAYALKFQAADRTLTDDEIKDSMRGIIESVRRKCGGILRT